MRTAGIGLRLAAVGLGALLIGAGWTVGSGSSVSAPDAEVARNGFTDYFRTAAGSVAGPALLVTNKEILNSWPESRVLAWARQEREGK